MKIKDQERNPEEWWNEYTKEYDLEFVSINDLNNGTMVRTIEWAIKTLTPEDIWIDCGAYIGAVSVPVIQIAKPYLAICIEPNSLGFPCLRDNLERYGSGAIALNTIVSNKPEIQEYQESAATGSLVREYGSRNKRQMMAVSIDSILKQYNPDHRKVVVKIDVELSEQLVWQGMKKSFLDIKEVAMEFFYEGAKLQGLDLLPLYKEIRGDGFKVFSLDDEKINQEEFKRRASKGNEDYILKR